MLKDTDVARRLVDLAHDESLITDAECSEAIDLIERQGRVEAERWLADRISQPKLDELKPIATAEGIIKSKESKNAIATMAISVNRTGTCHGTKSSQVTSTQDLEASSQSKVSLPEIPHYRAIKELGRGATGLVFLADDLRLGRQVAIKVVHGEGLLLQHYELRRFQGEAEALARLKHPNIVQVFEVGEWRNAHYLVLEYVQGGSLGELLKTSRPTPKQAARIVESLARALSCAHQNGIIHRDLKPANILLQESDDSEIRKSKTIDPFEHCEPKVSDFGIAKREGSVERTATGLILGTPQYMAPEQATGKSDELGPVTDVYGLGGILYEMLTGKPPFSGQTSAIILQKLISEDVVDPRRCATGIPNDLATICLKCLSKDSKSRYQTAVELADDLDRFLRGDAVRARPISPVEKAFRYVRRRPALSFAVLLFLLIWTVGFPLTFFLWRSSESAKDIAERRERETQHALAISRVSQAFNAWSSDDVQQAQYFLDQCPESERGWAWSYVKGLCDHCAIVIDVGRGWVKSICYSPDAKYIAVGSGTTPMNNNPNPPGFISLINTASNSVVWEVELPDNVTEVWFSPSGSRLLALSGNRLLVYDVVTRELEREIPASRKWGLSPSESCNAVVFRQEEGGPLFYFDVEGNTIQLLPMEMPERARVLLSAKGRWICLADLVRKEMRVVTCREGKTLCSWPIQEGDYVDFVSANDADEEFVYFPAASELRRIAVQTGQVTESWLATGKTTLSNNGRFAVVTERHTARTMDLVARQSNAIRLPNVMDHRFKFSPNGVWCAEAGNSHSVRLVNAATGDILQVLRGHSDIAIAVAFHPQLDILATAGQDQKVMIWDLRHNPSMSEAESWGGWERGMLMSGISFSGDRLRTMTANLVREFDTSSLTPVDDRPIARHVSGGFPITEGVFSADGEKIAVILQGETTRIAVHDISNLQEPVAVKDLGFKTYIRSISAAPDFDWIAWSSYRKTGDKTFDPAVHRWNWRTDEFSAWNTDDRISAVTISADGSELFVVTLREDESIISCVSVNSGNLKWRTPISDSMIPTLRLSPNKKLLAAANLSGGVWMFDVVTGKQTMILPGPVRCTEMAFSPDGKDLAAIGYDGNVLLWDVNSGLMQLKLAPDRPMRPEDWGTNARVVFSQDGKRIAASHWTGSIACWSVVGVGPHKLETDARRFDLLGEALQSPKQSQLAEHYRSRLDDKIPEWPFVRGMNAQWKLISGRREEAREEYESLAQLQPYRFHWHLLSLVARPMGHDGKLATDISKLTPEFQDIMRGFAFATSNKVGEGWDQELLGRLKARPDNDVMAHLPVLLVAVRQGHFEEFRPLATKWFREWNGAVVAANTMLALDAARQNDEVKTKQFRKASESALEVSANFGQFVTYEELAITQIVKELLTELDQIDVSSGSNQSP